ncbi:hypothetical protein [Cellulomonas sp. ATA003]|uniref:hypothetical protein n=1 Tax=Cellulomonas sp. ATA003 TaxID=3073064 RepID=UPI00287337F1|nr:hypothetical protein [Cellulomonas sp. ATA003]WNB85916.1 hypothetical protein REH70_00905 [Cellulomonas sp. ATA003]
MAPAAETADAATPRRRRSRRAIALGAVAAVLVAGAGAAAAVGAFRPDPVPAPPPHVVVLPSPTPTVAPVERQPTSPFADALPSTVLAFALTGITEERSLLLDGALEGHRLDYADGAGGTLTVLAGQWPTPEDARDAWTRAVREPGGGADASGEASADDPTSGEPDPDAPDPGDPTSGEVMVDGTPVGRWALTPVDDGTAVVTWTNGTALLQVTGPADVVRDVHAAFPL